MFLEPPHDIRAHGAIVLHHQDLHQAELPAADSTTRKTVPLPGSLSTVR
jgi:hypothetical protein